MSFLTPSNIYDLCELAYDAQGKPEKALANESLRLMPTLLDSESLRRINGNSGALFSSQSGFGFIARGKGTRKNELFFFTRGTASLADVGTDLNFMPT